MSFESEKFQSLCKFCRFTLYSVITIALAGCICIAVKNGFRLIDFQWKPIKIMMMGENPYLYTLNRIPFMGGAVDANQVPSCLLLLAPFAYLSYQTATIVWAYLNLVFTIVFCWFFFKSFWQENLKKSLFVLVTFMMLLGTPWRVLVGNGQHLIFSLTFFMASYYYAKQERHIVSGFMLALSAFKYTTIAPMAFIFIVARWWKPILIAALFHVVATIGCAFYLNESPITLITQSLQVGGLLLGQGDADLISLLYQMGITDVAWMSIVNYGFFLFLLSCLLFVGKKEDHLLKIAIFATISSAMFYHRVYDFVVLIFPLLLVFRDWKSILYVDWFVRWLTIANVCFLFYGAKILQVFLGFSETYYVCCCFGLTWGLLLILIVKDLKKTSV
jgi:hypothetical protein